MAKSKQKSSSLISIDPKIMLGKPCIAGTRITVELVICKLAEGASVQQLLDAHPNLTRQAIKAVRDYANQHENRLFLGLKKSIKYSGRFLRGKTVPGPTTRTKSSNTPVIKELMMIPNVGKAVADDLVRIGMTSKAKIAKQDPHKLYARLNKLDGITHDICMMDTFCAVVDYCNGKPAKPWWHYSRLRKSRDND